MYKRLLTCSVLVGAIGLLQYHSIQFWQDFTEPEIGIVWSLVLEGTALWLWYQGHIGTRVLGLCASLLLLAGPIYQVSAPLVAELERTANGDTTRVALIGELQSEVRSAELSLSAANDNATAAQRWQRAQWIPPIDKAQSRAETARGRLLTLMAKAPEATPVMTLRRQAVVVMQAATLVILQLAGILAITTLARGSTKPKPVESPIHIPAPKEIKLHTTPKRAPKRRALGRGLDELLNHKGAPAA